MTRDLAVWAVVAAADRFSVSDRETLALRLAARGVQAMNEAALVTCHRVEVYGLGDGDRANLPPDTLAGAPLAAPIVLYGDAAVRHLFRLAVGLESAVLGEDQVLHQVRIALGDLRDRRVDPRLIRLFELAVGAGRRVRARHRAADRNLGEIAIRWLEQRGVALRGQDVVVAGSGPIGRLVAGAAARRGARLVIASRSPDHARPVAERVRGVATDLAGGAASATSASAVVVALAGPWAEFGPRAPMPVVDLSFPPAVSSAARDALRDGFADVDRIFQEAGALQTDGGPSRDFRAGAEAVAHDALAAFRAWSAGRLSVATLRALREQSDERRAAELDRLMRRLPDLEPRERQLVEAFSQQLVAGLLHGPSAALREDIDGTAARAAQQLFGL